ncbi:hypothetical protein F5Y12DRAFT_305461 [Xylaria sp. FL1777]|nr:hypothetical protein F5Y12DRAFT_305461 [Xylaria sp. FL1777]
MCVKNIFSEQRPDGRLRTWTEGDFCRYARRGEFCERTQELRHPPGYRGPETRSSAYSYGQLPPTPPLSHSDYTSDSERSNKRRSGIYINDHKVLEVNRRHSSRHRRDGSGDRIYVGSSPLSRTPPIYQHSVPSSPIYDTYEPSYHDVDDRERSRERPTSIKVEIINEQPKSHRRQGSSSKTNSSRDSTGDERRQRRLSVHGDQQRQRRRESEIARQNEAIASRTPVPSSPRYRRGSVAIIPTIPVQERMRFKDEEIQEREIEAQRRRLKDRFEFKSYH